MGDNWAEGDRTVEGKKACVVLVCNNVPCGRSICDGVGGVWIASDHRLLLSGTAPAVELLLLLLMMMMMMMATPRNRPRQSSVNSNIIYSLILAFWLSW